ncbi:MAG: long-chain fatty acid--CoA ligase [Alphaproteobacteria bacterium]|nr:long-chain fatty acid--CoA ligase [Alphaproteobacteria bacterium]
MKYSERYERWNNLPQVFFEKAEELGDSPMLWAKRYGSWHPISWAEARDTVSSVSRGLRQLGVARGDRVLLVSENRPEWGLADLAIMSAGAITVPAYITNTVADHIHIVSDSDPRVAIVSNARLAERLLPAIRNTSSINNVVIMEGATGENEGVSIISWRNLYDSGVKAVDDVAEVVAATQRTDTSCLIYTSGTGGAPKGVMLSHGAILCNCAGAYHLFEADGMLELDNETFLSFLPLSHSYEHTAGLHFPITIGAQIYYAENADKLATNMGEMRPTIMTAVPRLYESMHQRIMAGIARKGGLSETLFRKAVTLGIKRYESGGLSLFERLQDVLLEKLVRKKVAKQFGGRLKAFVSGGAPLNYDIGVFFLALGVRLLQGYGQTETAPVISANPPSKIKIDTVGPAFPGVELRIAEDGEILIRGELTMQGYWNAPDLTAETLREGWIHTGDIGVRDADGYIKITDRKKDIIVNSGGDNISPQRVEGALVFEPEINQAMVYGDKRPHLVALLVPDDEFFRSWTNDNDRDVDLAELTDLKPLYEALRAAIERTNERLPQTEQIRRFLVAEEPFTTENGLMTPSLKIRRHEINKIYGERLEALYGRAKT